MLHHTAVAALLLLASPVVVTNGDAAADFDTIVRRGAHDDDCGTHDANNTETTQVILAIEQHLDAIHGPHRTRRTIDTLQPLRIPVKFVHFVDSRTTLVTEDSCKYQIAEMNKDFGGRPWANVDQPNIGTGPDARVSFYFESLEQIRDSRCTTLDVRGQRDNYCKNLADGGNGDPTRFLYIFLAELVSTLGYARFPYQDAETSMMYSSVIQVENMPSPFQISSFFGKKHTTAAHEVGHQFGLYHVFQGGCLWSGDGVHDTPACIRTFGSCNFQQDTCPGQTAWNSIPGNDPVDNIMHYQDCRGKFTAGQITRMHDSLETFKPTAFANWKANAQRVFEPIQDSECCVVQETRGSFDLPSCSVADCCSYCNGGPGTNSSLNNCPGDFDIYWKSCGIMQCERPAVSDRCSTPAPTVSPTVAPPPPASCISGDAELPRLDVATGHVSKVQVRKIEEGDVVQGAVGDNLVPEFCTVEAIGSFGYGPVYGNYTDHHLLLDNATKSVVAHGTRNRSTTDVDKYVVLLGSSVNDHDESCMAGIDATANLYTPLDTDFCGKDVDLSFEQYKLLYTSILRTVRRSGGFWLQLASYTGRTISGSDGEVTVVQQWNEFTPKLCVSMLACAESASATSEECATYEALGVEFVDGFLTPEAQNATHIGLPNLGHPGLNGSAAFAVTDASNDDTDWHIVVVVLGAAVLVAGVVGAVVIVAIRRRRQRSADDDAVNTIVHDACDTYEVDPPAMMLVEDVQDTVSATGVSERTAEELV
mmetsp:Transcript_19386/g.57645  ORF Transcript_19386/g.57645 Transcript_19386/m.57645 type:complete len:761 (+) Transcript_19386:267-2549(+)